MCTCVSAGSVLEFIRCGKSCLHSRHPRLPSHAPKQLHLPNYARRQQANHLPFMARHPLRKQPSRTRISPPQRLHSRRVLPRGRDNQRLHCQNRPNPHAQRCGRLHARQSVRPSKRHEARRPKHCPSCPRTRLRRHCPSYSRTHPRTRQSTSPNRRLQSRSPLGPPQQGQTPSRRHREDNLRRPQRRGCTLLTLGRNRQRKRLRTLPEGHWRI